MKEKSEGTIRKDRFKIRIGKRERERGMVKEKEKARKKCKSAKRKIREM